MKLGAFNRTDYSNPKVDALLLQEAIQELDDAKRRDLFEQAMDIIMDDRVLISIVNLQSVWASKKGKLKMTPRTDEDTLAFFIKAAN